LEVKTLFRGTPDHFSTFFFVFKEFNDEFQRFGDIFFFLSDVFKNRFRLDQYYPQGTDNGKIGYFEQDAAMSAMDSISIYRRSVLPAHSTEERDDRARLILLTD